VRRPRDRASAAALAGFVLLAFCFFGLRVVAHPERDYIGGIAADPQIFVWSFAWWPHAILHGQNPLFTHAIWAPDGFNLTWATSVPGLAIAFAPLTLAFGPILAYNVASILIPALAAWTAFLLCRRVTRSVWPSVVGGYLFGFSGYMLGGELDHMHTTAVFLLPVLAIVLLRYLDGELGAVRVTVLVAVIVVVQLSFSTEVLFTLTVALGTAFVLAYLLAPARRRRLRSLVMPLAGGYALAAAIAAPFVYFVVTGTSFKPGPGPENYVADVANFAVPTHVEAAGWWADGFASHLPANDVERGTYLGIPVLVIVAWFAARRMRTPAGRFLVIAIVAGAVASLGSWLTVYGHRLITLPWIHLAGLPLFEHVMPVRLSVFTALAAAVVVAIWAASAAAPVWVRIVLPALAVLALVPNVGWKGWARTPDVPALFTSASYRSCLQPGENVIAFPYGPRGDSLIWQAVDGFRFRLAGGYISPKIPDGFTAPASIEHLTTADNPAEVTLASIRELARLKGVSHVIVAQSDEAEWRSVLSPLGRPVTVGGAVVYRLPGAAPLSCGVS
jgi:hypothetical protein